MSSVSGQRVRAMHRDTERKMETITACLVYCLCLHSLSACQTCPLGQCVRLCPTGTGQCDCLCPKRTSGCLHQGHSSPPCFSVSPSLLPVLRGKRQMLGLAKCPCWLTNISTIRLDRLKLWHQPVCGSCGTYNFCGPTRNSTQKTKMVVWQNYFICKFCFFFPKNPDIQKEKNHNYFCYKNIRSTYLWQESFSAYKWTEKRKYQWCESDRKCSPASMRYNIEHRGINWTTMINALGYVNNQS